MGNERPAPPPATARPNSASPGYNPLGEPGTFIGHALGKRAPVPGCGVSLRYWAPIESAPNELAKYFLYREARYGCRARQRRRPSRVMGAWLLRARCPISAEGAPLRIGFSTHRFDEHGERISPPDTMGSSVPTHKAIRRTTSSSDHAGIFYEEIRAGWRAPSIGALSEGFPPTRFAFRHRNGAKRERTPQGFVLDNMMATIVANNVLL